MSGVWVFKNGVFRLVENPAAEAGQSVPSGSKRKVLVHSPTNQVVTSYDELERKLSALGWERYYHDRPNLLQFHKRSSPDLISVPRDFAKFKSVHMYDIVVKNKDVFEVREV